MEENAGFHKQLPTPDLPTLRNFIFLENQMILLLKINGKICFLFFSKNACRRNAVGSFSGNIDEMVSIK